MKAREQRHRIMVTARMLGPAGWTDVRIHNVSSRGLMIESAKPPAAGSYVELRRGQNRILARVVWGKDRRAGLRAQDRIHVDALVAERPVASPEEERRSAAREPQAPHRAAIAGRAFESSRQAARTAEFSSIAAAAALAAMLLAAGLYEAGSRLIAPVRAELTRGTG